MNHYPKSTSFFKRKLRAAGDFYMRHRRVFATAKVVILAGVMTFAFTVRSDNGKSVQHGAASIFADSQCGNGKCDIYPSSCLVSNTNCSLITAVAACATVSGCSVESQDTYTCSGTTFAPGGIGSQKQCEAVGLPWDSKASKCVDMGINSCSSLKTSNACAAGGGAVGDCIWAVSSNTLLCTGAIENPVDQNGCTALNTIMKQFSNDYTTRYPAYIEDSKSCPADCNIALPSITINSMTSKGGNGSDPIFDVSLVNIYSATTGYNSIFVQKSVSGDTWEYVTYIGYIAGLIIPNSPFSGNITGSYSMPVMPQGLYYRIEGKDFNGNAVYSDSFFYTPTTTQTCGNRMREGTEICDDGPNNGTIGYCNTGCTALVAPYCTGTIVSTAFSGKTMCYNLGPADLAAPGAECGNYYSIMNYQCSYDKKSGNCMEGNICTIPEIKPVCGDGKIEGKEKCDDGKNNGTTGYCNSKCSGQYVPPAQRGGSGLLSTGICAKVTEIASGECGELVKIYNSTSGSKWTNNSNRGNTKNICRNGGSGSTDFSGNDLGRYGVYCLDKHVAAIALKENNLVGYFDADFYQLPNLLMLALPRNPGLTGMSPTLSGAQSLTMIKLNGWRGNFPAEIAYLQNMEYVRVDDVDTREMWYMTGLFPKLKGISINNNHLTTISDMIMTLRPKLEFVDFSYNCIDYTQFSATLLDYLDTRQADTNSGWKDNQTNCEQIKAKCGDGKVEGKEFCDDGEKNGIGGFCNTTCEYKLPAAASCGNGIIEKWETCDNGMNNSKPGQCNKTCNGRTTYNLYCGDGLCRSSCTLDKAITTCKDLNSVTNGKELCTTLGCSLQYVDNTSCNGTIKCEDIVPEKFWGTTEGAQKYCNIAGCNRDSKKSACTTTNKAPSCNDIGSTLGLKNTTEYCPRIPGCALSATTQAASTTCVGDMVPRADKLNEKQCTALNSKWASEDINSCSNDCNTTCGNGTCDPKETATSCPSDCVKDRPEIKYSIPAPLNGSTIKGPVMSSVVLPEGCKIINNNGSTGYTFEYNGYYVFQVACPWFDKPWDMIAKVYRLANDTTITLPNARDMASAVSGGTNIYFENKNQLVTDVTTNPAMAEAAKKDLMQKAFANSTSSGSATSGMDAPVTTTKNISFENDPNVYQKIIFEGTGVKKGSTLTVPADVILQTEINGKKTDFDGVFLAPRDVTGTVLTEATKTIKNMETIIKAGDENDDKLIAVDSSGNAVEFTLTIETQDPVGSIVNVYASQDGVTWTDYGEATVQTDGTINFVEIIVPHLTYYGVTTNMTGATGGTDTGTTPSGGSQPSGGGGGGTATNQCTADRDCKNSYLNTLCGPCSEAAKVAEVKAKETSVVCYSYTPELNGAYAFAFANAITTIDDCEKANLQGTLLRSHMAKMMSNFAINTLGIKPNTGTICNFIDMSKESDEMKFYANLACQLGLMGLNDQGTANETFNPNETVTRAQFGTVLSRLIREKENNGGTPYYTKHLAALKDAGIMTKIDTPNTKELRGFVMLMLQRVTSQVSPAENGGKTLRELVKEFFTKK